VEGLGAGGEAHVHCTAAHLAQGRAVAAVHQQRGLLGELDDRIRSVPRVADVAGAGVYTSWRWPGHA
jgi:hypothetical protein